MPTRLHWILRHRWVAVALILGLTALSLWGFLGQHYALRRRGVFWDDEQRLYEDVTRSFASDFGECVVVIESDSFFSPAGARWLRSIESAVEAVRGVESAVGLDDVPWFAEGLPRSLLPRGDAPPAAWEAAREAALEHPLVGGQLLAPDGRTLLLPVRFADDAQPLEASESVRDAASGVRAPPGARVRTTGKYVLWNEHRLAFRRDRARLQTWAGVLVSVLGLMLFRGFTAAAIAGAAPAVGVFWAFGLLSLLGENVAGMTKVVVPVMLLMVGFTDSVHLMLFIRRERGRGQAPLDAVSSALTELLGACFLTSLTTAIGFGSLLFARSDMVTRFGFASAVGAGTTFLAVVTVLPLLASTRLGERLLPPRPTRHGRALAARFAAGFEHVLAHPVAISVAGAFLTLSLAAYALGLRPNDPLTGDLPRNNDAGQATEHVDHAFGGVVPMHVLVQWDGPETFTWDALLDELAWIEGELSRAGLFAPVSLRGLLAALPAFPTGSDSELARRVPWLGLVPEELQRAFLHPERREALVTARMPSLWSAGIEPIVEELRRTLAERASSGDRFDLSLTGAAALDARWHANITADLLQSLAIAAVIIFVVLVLAFRSLRIGVLSLLPNLFPLVAAGAALRALGFSLRLASACAFVVCLGIAVDDTVHFLARRRRARRAGKSEQDALREAFAKVGGAMAISTLIMVSGFALVVTSELTGTRAFGTISCATIAAALVGDLVLFPALLAAFGGRATRFGRAGQSAD